MIGTVGKYGLMRRTYLEENRPVEYQKMVREGTLEAHLVEVNTEAKRQMELQMEALNKTHPAPDQNDFLATVQHKNMLKEMAEEFVLPQVVYA